MIEGLNDGDAAQGRSRLDWAALSARLAGRAAHHDETATVCRENLAELQAAGLLGLTVSAQHGGAGARLAAVAEVVGQVAEADPATALILAMHLLSHAAIARSAHWPESVRSMVSQATLSEGALLNALRVEPALGTPARGGMPATTARQDGKGWRISGSKIYSTGSSVLRWGMVWAATDEQEPRLGTFLVPLDAPGVSIERSWNQVGMRATDSHTVVMRDVRLPLEYGTDIRAPIGWGAPDPIPATWLNVLLARLYDGVARAARRWLIGFLHRRVPTSLGAPLSTLPRFHELVGEIDGLLLANRRILEATIAADARGEPPSFAEGGLVKHLVTENAIRVVERAVAMIGNPGLSRDHPLERHLRDVLCGRAHTPQADAALAASGRLSLAL